MWRCPVVNHMRQRSVEVLNKCSRWKRLTYLFHGTFWASAKTRRAIKNIHVNIGPLTGSYIYFLTDFNGILIDIWKTRWRYQSVRLVEVCELVLLLVLRPPALAPRSLLPLPQPGRAMQPPQRGSGAGRPDKLHYPGEVGHGLWQLPSHEQGQESHHITSPRKLKHERK